MRRGEIIMKLQEIINRTKKPMTKLDLIKAFKQLKVNQQELLMVYADLKAFSYVIGGAQTVLEALYEVAGYHTTIIMPAHQLNQTCPTFFDERLPNEWKHIVYEQMPAFDKECSPILAGEISETFSMNKNVFRSEHPIASYLAAGRKADWFMANHSLQSMFGEKSPLQKLYAQDAKLLCLGVDYNQLTALHLAEYFSNCRPKMKHEAIIIQNGKRTLVEFEDLALNSTLFDKIGKAYEQTNEIQTYLLDGTKCSLIDYRSFIDFATEFLKNN